MVFYSLDCYILFTLVPRNFYLFDMRADDEKMPSLLMVRQWKSNILIIFVVYTNLSDFLYNKQSLGKLNFCCFSYFIFTHFICLLFILTHFRLAVAYKLPRFWKDFNLRRKMLLIIKKRASKSRLRQLFPSNKSKSLSYL